MTDQIFIDWTDANSRDYGKSIVHVHHRLHDSPLFTDEALARLIEIYPREHYDLHTMTEDAASHNKDSWREGDLGACSGEDVIEAIRHGHIWLNLRKVMTVSMDYAELLERMFAETESHVPGLRTYKHNLGILISSPKAQVFYHADIPGQSLWQLRGKKRVYIYPFGAPFLSQEAMERIVLGEADESEMVYEPWYDDHATVFDLAPGEMLHWPLNGPHRVVNLDTLNVSVTTEHWTDAVRASYLAHYANGILRRHGVSNPRHTTAGPVFWAKAALAAAYKFGGAQKKRRFEHWIDFAIDPAAPRGWIDIPPRLRTEF